MNLGELNLKIRIPEKEEAMVGSEAENYFLAHRFNPEDKGNVYSITCIDIFKRINLKGNSVLDIGCGYGALIKQANHFNPNLIYTGIDSSNDMVRIARTINKGINAKFYKSNVNKTRLKNNSFDLVICKDAFHHFIKPLKVLKEMIRVTKQGGSIYITDLKRNTPIKIITQVYNELASKNITNARQYIDSINAAYTISEVKIFFSKVNIKKYKIWEAKVGKRFIQEYDINKKNSLSAKNFIRDRWIAIIKK